MFELFMFIYWMFVGVNALLLCFNDNLDTGLDAKEAGVFITLSVISFLPFFNVFLFGVLLVCIYQSKK